MRRITAKFRVPGTKTPQRRATQQFTPERFVHHRWVSIVCPLTNALVRVCDSRL